MKEFRPPATWDAFRRKTHDALYPPAKKAERNAAAQMRYRENHAEEIAAARRLANRLLHHDDIETLAGILREFLTADQRRDLCKALQSRRRHNRK